MFDSKADCIRETGRAACGRQRCEAHELRVRPEQKALLARAAAPKQTDLTSFVTRAALREAEAVVEEAEQLKLSETDSLRVLALVEDPPAANARLRAAVLAMPKPR